MPFLAGQKLRASQLQELEDDIAAIEQEIVVARVAADLSKTSNTTLSDVTGISFALAANAEYLLDGCISYYGLDAPDIKFAWTGPTGMTVSWGFRGAAAAGTDGSTATLSVASLEVYGDANLIAVGTEVDFAVMCTPLGYFKTGGTAGTLQLRWAQFVSSASVTSIKRGSWARLHRFA